MSARELLQAAAGGINTKLLRFGIIGCGAISDIYLKNLAERFGGTVEVAACADIVLERSIEKAKKHKVPRACTVEELLADASIDAVINLTVPNAHASVSLAALRAGKHVYTEKPLATTRVLGAEILRVAKECRLTAGAAPDTFLGGTTQTARKLIDDNWIGTPIGGTAFYSSHGHENWHPDPAFFYKPGAGPLLDMGPYYLTTLVSLLGPIKRVSGSASISFLERIVGSEPKRGSVIKVEVPTHVVGILEFRAGSTFLIMTSFDVWKSQLPHIEIYGTAGTLQLPSPNDFSGPLQLWKPGFDETVQMPTIHRFTENCRGLGAAEMANAIQRGKAPRASAELAFHVLDVLEGIIQSSKTGQYYEVESACSLPEPLGPDYAISG